jgi:hypothetical protein
MTFGSSLRGAQRRSNLDRPKPPAARVALMRRGIETTARLLGPLLGCAALLVGAFALLTWWLARPWSRDYATYRFAPDTEIRLTIHGDFDNPAALYYEVRARGEVIIPPSFLGLEPEDDHPLDVHRGTSADGSIVAIWWPADGSGDVVLFHRPSGESFPRLADTDTLLYRDVGLKWRARYTLLRDVHPELPPPEKVVWLEDEATAGTR